MVLQSSVAIFQWDMHFYYFYKYATTTSFIFSFYKTALHLTTICWYRHPIASQAELQLSLDLSFRCKKWNICFFNKLNMHIYSPHHSNNLTSSPTHPDASTSVACCPDWHANTIASYISLASQAISLAKMVRKWLNFIKLVACCLPHYYFYSYSL